MKASVIIPVFGKYVDIIGKCIKGLSGQTILPEEIVIVTDRDIKFSDSNKVRVILIEKPLTIARALNEGLKHCTGDIICFTDPDTLPYNNWIEKIMDVYKGDSSIGGVGGQDEIYKNDKLTKAKQVKSVGKLEPYGRLIGNHHNLLAGAQEVDFLKGANMSFRRELITGFDERISGFYWWEQPVCFDIRNKGYKLIFHPGIKVKHFKYKEAIDHEKSIFMHSRNTTYLLLRYVFLRKKIIFLLYTFCVGQTHGPGILKVLASVFSLNSIGRFFASVRGKFQGVKLFLSARP